MKMLALGVTSQDPWLGVVRHSGETWRWDDGNAVDESNWTPEEPRFDGGNCTFMNTARDFKWEVRMCRGILKTVVCEASGPLESDSSNFPEFASGSNAIASNYVHVISSVMAVNVTSYAQVICIAVIVNVIVRVFHTGRYGILIV